jgi:signal transduction histidine kinase
VETSRLRSGTTDATTGIRITIRDHGTGVRPEDLPRVFDPYFTTKRTGSGLGLAIAKNIIEGLGGSISLESHPGRGTEIRIDLPLQGAPDLAGQNRMFVEPRA